MFVSEHFSIWIGGAKLIERILVDFVEILVEALVRSLSSSQYIKPKDYECTHLVHSAGELNLTELGCIKYRLA